MSLSVHRLSWAKILNLANNHLSWSLAVKHMRVCGHDVSSNSNNSADTHSNIHILTHTLTHSHTHTETHVSRSVRRTLRKVGNKNCLRFFPDFFVNLAQLKNVDAAFCVIVNRLFCMHAELYIINYSMSVHISKCICI